jgi:DNA-binding beta-propeller fold protein YncE
MNKNISCLSMVACGAILLWTAPSRSRAQTAPAQIGLFEGHTDVGTVLHAGSAKYEASKRSYTITGSGDNMWAAEDDFQFVWKRASGDVTLTADVAILGSEGNAHRKGVLMIRQSLDKDSAYASVAVHGNGLAALQSREAKGADTYEVISNITTPARLRIIKQGQYFYLALGGRGQTPRIAGGSLRIPIEKSFYVGLGVCAHDKDAVQTVVFSNVGLVTTSPAAGTKPTLYSTLETVPIATATDRKVLLSTPGRIEAPNWTHDGGSVLFNSNGRIKRVPVAGGAPQPIDTGFATRCDGNYGISPDGTLLAITDSSRGGSTVYVLPIAGGAPRRVTQTSPSYWNAWSPDGKTLVFSGERNGRLDLYAIPAAGGAETRLTTAPGRNQNAEYSPDGKYIYFNSDRAGSMQIWRMLPDGAGQEQVTSDNFDNWRPRLSPDGRWMALLSCGKSATTPPQDTDATLRLLSLADRKIAVLANLLGGQWTLGAFPWSPDSNSVAFVSYQLVR